MRFEKTDVYGMTAALRGMRNPMNSHDKSDTVGVNCDSSGRCCKNVCIGKNDLDLASRLARAGSEHRKFMRQIFVSVDITAPQYWWAEFDTYKVGVTRDSSSLQHKGASRDFTFDDFEVGKEVRDTVRCLAMNDDVHVSFEEIGLKLGEAADYVEELLLRVKNDGSCLYWQWVYLIDELNELRHRFCETGNYEDFLNMRRLLPMSYMYKSTVTMSYENILNMVTQRKRHKLPEWSVDFVGWARTLPYAENLLFLE